MEKDGKRWKKMEKEKKKNRVHVSTRWGQDRAPMRIQREYKENTKRIQREYKERTSGRRLTSTVVPHDVAEEVKILRRRESCLNVKKDQNRERNHQGKERNELNDV